MADIEALAKRLDELAHAVTEGNRAEFTMRVPADPKRDADIVLLDAATALVELSSKLSALQNDFERYVNEKIVEVGELRTDLEKAESRIDAQELELKDLRGQLIEHQDVDDENQQLKSRLDALREVVNVNAYMQTTSFWHEVAKIVRDGVVERL